MRVSLAILDPGVRSVVARLNSIEGVTTRASCEGHTRLLPGHRHADVAYVAFEYLLPPSFEEFLVTELGMYGRIEADAVYSRWPEHNRQFLDRLQQAVERYRVRRQAQRRQQACCRLNRLRSRLAMAVASGGSATASLCLECRAVVVGAHRCTGKILPLVSWSPGRQRVWFQAFLHESGNRLSTDLVARLSAADLERRARRGDFGSSFGQRWLRYRNQAAKQDLVCSLRAGIEELRARGSDVDVLFQAQDVCVTWRCL